MTEGSDPPDADPPARASLRQWLARMEFKDLVDLVAKLAAPAAVILGGVLAHSFQSSLSMTQLMAAREDADTKIRAEMFRAISDRLIGPNAAPDPERRAVFGELLALNFHEHFELKPLLMDVDEGLRAEIEKAPADRRAALVDQRFELVSVARRVRQRQTQMLVRPSAFENKPVEAGMQNPGSWWRFQPQESQYSDGAIKTFSVRFGGKIPTADEDPRTPCDVVKTVEIGKSACFMEPIFENAPDGQSAVAISVINADWNKETFTMVVKPVPRFVQEDEGDRIKPPRPIGDAPKCEAPKPDPEGHASGSSGSVVFDISWFDLPLTDNSLLWGGSRYALFIDNVCKEKTGGEVVKFGLMWFPRDFFPPRERPTNYQEFRRTLNLSNRR